MQQPSRPVPRGHPFDNRLVRISADEPELPDGGLAGVSPRRALHRAPAIPKRVRRTGREPLDGSRPTHFPGHGGAQEALGDGAPGADPGAVGSLQAAGKLC